MTTYATPAEALAAADAAWCTSVDAKLAKKAARVAVCANGQRVAYDLWGKHGGKTQKVGSIAVARSGDGWVIA